MLARSGNRTAYGNFCKRMLKRFGEDHDISAVEQTIKVSLLLPDSIDLSELPLSRLRQLLESKQVTTSFAPWGWATCALGEYRRGDTEALQRVIEQAEAAPEYAKNIRARTMLLFVKAIALYEQSKTDEAQAAYTEAQGLLDERLAMHQANGTWHHDDLIVLMLKAEVDAKRKPKE